MREATIRDRLRYAFDNYMARGTVALVLGLSAITAAIIVLISLVIWEAGWAERAIGLPGVLWRSLLASFDPSLVGGESGSPGFLLALLVVTFGGIFVTSVMIGILTTGIEGRLAVLRKGRSWVIGSGHTVILGWSQQVFTILAELANASAEQRGATVVVLAERDKVEMEDQIRERMGRTRRFRVVSRSGSPIDSGDLHIASIETARSIIVLSTPTKHADAGVIKTILAITNSPNRRADPYHIVAEIRNPSNLETARIAGGQEAQLVVVGDLVARIIAQTCRQSGLSVIYEILMDFEGDEIVIVDPPAELVGRTFGELLGMFERSALIGLEVARSTADLNPPMDRRLEPGDRLIAISSDEESVRAGVRRADAASAGGVQEDLIRPAAQGAKAPERTLLLGWNYRAGSILKYLDAYVAPGSQVSVVVEHADVDALIGPFRSSVANQDVTARRGDPTDRHLLQAVCSEKYDHVIVLAPDDVDPQLADARTLMTLLHLREISGGTGQDFSITSEMIDVRNRALAQVTQADDFIVSDRIASLLLSQLSVNEHLKAVFDDLFDAEGSEIYLKPVGDYVETGQSVRFRTVVESARRRGEVAIGYRRMALSNDPGLSYGVVINPRKSDEIAFDPADRVVVLATEG